MIADNLKVDRQVDDTSRYSRKILLATVGLSPQVVTETAYALMMSDNSPFIPSEIVIISTTTGAKNAKEQLLGTANARISCPQMLHWILYCQYHQVLCRHGWSQSQNQRSAEMNLSTHGRAFPATISWR